MNQDLERIAYWYTSGTGKVLDLNFEGTWFCAVVNGISNFGAQSHFQRVSAYLGLFS